MCRQSAHRNTTRMDSILEDGNVTTQGTTVVNQVTVDNMQSVSSNAVANRLGNFNTDAGYFITDAMKTSIRTSFNNTSQYSM